MRELDIGTKRFTKVGTLGKPGNGGVYYKYLIESVKDRSSVEGYPDVFGSITFQNGPIKEVGVNGCHVEDLLAIAIDRLRGFQSGKFACNENAIALGYLEQTLYQLNKRTEDRIKRGVEGTSQI